MLLDQLRAHARNFNDPTRRQALADAYTPIVRGFLLPCAAYYLFVTWAHWRDESEQNFALLGTISVSTAIIALALRQFYLSSDRNSLGRLEFAGIIANMLIYTNVVSYQLIHFEPGKLTYFPLMAVVFSTSSVTGRSMLFFVVLSIGTHVWFATRLSQTGMEQQMFIGVATAFAALAMAFLLRKAMVRQVDARLRADMLAERAGQLAETDALTNLPNRRAIFDALERNVAQNRPCWLGLVDLDGFKTINDVYSHSFGDTLLGAVADRCRASIDENTHLGRIEGDQFALIFDGSLSAEEVKSRVRKVIAAVSNSYTIAHTKVNVGSTAGLCHYPEMARGASELYEWADFALYRAKTSLRGEAYIFDTKYRREMEAHLILERALREGDLESELHMLFQPQYSLAEARIVGFEALARYRQR